MQRLLCTHTSDVNSVKRVRTHIYSRQSQLLLVYYAMEGNFSVYRRMGYSQFSLFKLSSEQNVSVTHQSDTWASDVIKRGVAGVRPSFPIKLHYFYCMYCGTNLSSFYACTEVSFWLVGKFFDFSVKK